MSTYVQTKQADAQKTTIKSFQSSRPFLDNRASTAAQLSQQQLMARSPATAQLKLQQSAMQIEGPMQLMEEDDEPCQGKMISPAEDPGQSAPPRKAGALPHQLKAGIEALSGMNMDHVSVHYNSSKPAQLNAHAYAQGSEIHLSTGQEKHLPHEAWHVVQQAQGRVKPTTQLKSDIPINDDPALEHEADQMGAKAIGIGEKFSLHTNSGSAQLKFNGTTAAIQLVSANRTGTFNSAAPKAPTNAAMPPMQAPAYGGLSVNSTGMMGSRSGIHNPAYGSGVGGVRPPNWSTLTALTGSNPWVQLHLLNDNLGGRGQATNLAPGSRSFNSHHLKGAETPVKNWAGHSGAPQAANQAADYVVTAQYAGPLPVINELHMMYDQTNNAQAKITNLQTQYYKAYWQYLYLNNPAFAQMAYSHDQAEMQYQMQYQQTINQITANYFQHINQTGNPQSFVSTIPIPQPPVKPLALIQIEQQLVQMAYAQAVQDVQTTATQEKQWITNYVTNTFPSSFTCTATFYEEKPGGTGQIYATSPQQITISY